MGSMFKYCIFKLGCGSFSILFRRMKLLITPLLAAAIRVTLVSWRVILCPRARATCDVPYVSRYRYSLLLACDFRQC
jgi:hypothetical protein